MCQWQQLARNWVTWDLAVNLLTAALNLRHSICTPIILVLKVKAKARQLYLREHVLIGLLKILEIQMGVNQYKQNKSKKLQHGSC